MNASDVLVERLLAWGVDTIFGLPGDGINGVMEALRKAKNKIRFIHVRHEESAAFMACAYAKFTGRLGVCLSTSGPGGLHLLNGLYDAKLDQAPVLAITGMQFRDVTGTYSQQDVELDNVFMDVACYNERVMCAPHMECSGTLATMACGMPMPYAIAAQVAFPDRQVIGIVGDGGFTMLMGEIITAVTYKLPIKLVILKNNTLGQIKWEQMVFEGNPEYQCDLMPIDFVALAKAVGANGVRIDDPAKAAEQFERALAMLGPVIIEAEVDPNTAMLPAKIKAKQAIKFSEALMRGEPNRMRIALTAASDTVRQMI